MPLNFYIDHLPGKSMGMVHYIPREPDNLAQRDIYDNHQIVLAKMDLIKCHAKHFLLRKNNIRVIRNLEQFEITIEYKNTSKINEQTPFTPQNNTRKRSRSNYMDSKSTSSSRRKINSHQIFCIEQNLSIKILNNV